MNVERIKQLAAYLRQPEVDDHFDLNMWVHFPPEVRDQRPAMQAIHTCGAVACIAGHASILARPKLSVSGAYCQSQYEVARGWLGLSAEQADNLFGPSGDLVDYDEVTASIAADVLDHFAATGEIVWPAEVLFDE